jgi:UDP-N-acetylmuramate dehydrogenase
VNAGVAVDAVVARLEQALPGRVERMAPSAPLVTYRCGGPLHALVHAHSDADLVALAGALAADPAVPLLVIGRGSNLLVADGGFAGVALVLEGAFEEMAIEGAEVDAGAAVALPVLARRTAAAGVAGLEFFVGIPGSVGGAVRMNAGGHGAQTDDVIVGARLFDLADATFRDVAPAALGLGYRTSAVGAGTVVAGARFAGRVDDPAACAARIDEIVRWRREHQPGGQNAGSVFTNPPGDAAGRLIDAAGCKGLRSGAAVVSEKHANFIVAEPGARAADVHTLVLLVRDRVEAQTGVRLHPELRLVGFEDEEDR